MSEKTGQNQMRKNVLKLLLITLGCLSAAFALECFLVPNKVIDGGVVGISIMLSYILKPKLAFFLVVLNLPFLLMAYKRFGKDFVFSTFYAVSMFAGFTIFIDHHFHVITEDLVLAAVFGGIFLGFGVGLVLRNNASLDGTEILAISVTKRTTFSTGEIIMFLNIFIFFCAGFLLGWDRAMYSALTYFITYKVIDGVLQGLSESKSIFIISQKYKELGEALMKGLEVGITYISATGGYLGQKKQIIYCVVPRFLLVKIKDLINTIDPEAFLAIENVHEVEGKSIRRKKH